MMKLQAYEEANILHIGDHYEGRVNGRAVVSGDTWNEVYQDLIEMGYIK